MNVPQWRKNWQSSRWANIFIAKPTERLMPWTNQHISQFACTKRKYHQLQKTLIFPGAYGQGFAPMGFQNWSVKRSQKKTFQRIWKTMRSFSLLDFKKTNSTIDSPADTCGYQLPKGLEVSFVFSPMLIRIWHKKTAYHLGYFKTRGIYQE